MTCKDSAESFYNAYLILRDSNDQKLKHLESLSNVYNQNPSRNVNPAAINMPMTMGVDIVCLAFSLELYLKNLHFLCGKKTRGHDILKLFDALPEGVKSDIYKADQNVSFYTLEGYRKQLELISNGFEKWRYAYERTCIKYNSSLAISLIEAIKKVSASKECELYLQARTQRIRKSSC